MLLSVQGLMIRDCVYRADARLRGKLLSSLTNTHISSITPFLRPATVYMTISICTEAIFASI